MGLDIDSLPVAVTAREIANALVYRGYMADAWNEVLGQYAPSHEHSTARAASP